MDVLLEAKERGFDSVLLKGAHQGAGVLAVLRDDLGVARDPMRAAFDHAKKGLPGLTLGLGGLGIGTLAAAPGER